MTDLTPNHPAVEPAAREIYVNDAPSNDPQTWPPTPAALADDYRWSAIQAIAAALPHLTADDLRNTPAGKQLMAEGWKAALVQLEALAQTYNDKRDHLMAGDLLFAHERIARHNPYREGDA